MLRSVSSKKKKKRKLLSWQKKLGMHCDDNEGKMETEGGGGGNRELGWSALPVWRSRWASARLGPAPLSPHLPSQPSEPQEQEEEEEENIWSFCVVGILRRSLDSVGLFSTRPVCCAAPVLLCTGPVSSTEGCILESCCQEVQLTGSFFVCGLKSL